MKFINMMLLTIFMLFTTNVNGMNINPDGTGQVLIYPYYTVNGGNQTLLSVVNTTSQGKAVKIRFLEGRNSREVLDFNLYLAAYDVWTGAIFSLVENGPANLVTLDKSCTAPTFANNAELPSLSNGVKYAPFRNYKYTGTNNDSGPDSVARTREGHFEMIEMGTVINGTRNSLNALTHTNGVPNNCAQIRNAWVSGGYWTVDDTVDITAPSGGLFGSASIIDTMNGTMLSYNAEAIDNFSAHDLHTDPGSLLPNLASGSSDMMNGTVTANLFVNGQIVQNTYSLSNAIDAVSALFMNEYLLNEFGTSLNMGAASEWVVTFPTKNFYVDTPASQATAPFVNVFPRNGNQGTAPVDVAIQVFDRNGSNYETEDCGEDCLPFSPQPPEQHSINPQLLWETNVITINQSNSANGSEILGSTLTANVNTQIDNGWMKLKFSGMLRSSTNGGMLVGLPVTGFLAQSFTNNAVTPGVLSNYSGTFKHRAIKRYVD